MTSVDRNLVRAALAAALVVATVQIVARAADPPAAATPEALEFFEKKVRPLLVEHCLECHGEKAQGGLRLDSRAAVFKGGDNGAVIIAGDAEHSPLVRAVRYQSDTKMPPDGKLSDEAIATLAHWVQTGAAWPAEAAGAAKGTDKLSWKSHWAFQPIARPARPAVKTTAWPTGDLDHFILARLESASLAPSPRADLRTLARRASFDVTGLPPEPADVERLVNDPSPGAFASYVERLLASPHYGERWGRHWLDVARYADTKGYVFTQDRSYPNAYRYRDWVVRALNEDMPYDQFLIQQIAADRLLVGDDKSPLAAMGFLTVGRRFLNNPHDIIDDRLDVLTRGTMGLTVTCARCHDHKYDPIPTRDYYSLYGVLASSVEPAEPAEYMTLADAAQPVVPRVFVRGNSGNHGDAVPRQFLSAISGESRQPFGAGSGRLDLARAIASRDNPLTARVMANRVWLHYFDAPLVRTPSDFGLRSEPPTHPELLDHLAGSLIDSGWSLKQLHRAILNSATYQQASLDRPDGYAVDPENRLLYRMNRKRLDFEALRDALLATSGQLDRRIGGPAADMMTTPWTLRRTIYGLIDRQNLPNLFRTFDFASPDTHSPQRFTTTVPQQALFMLNSPFLLDQARALAARSELAQLDNTARVDKLYHLVLERSPNATERQAALAFLAAEEPATAPPASATAAASEGAASGPTGTPVKAPTGGLSSWERLVQVILLSNEFVYVD